MLKLKNLVLAGIVAFLASACTMPEYQLQFEVVGTPTYSSSAPYYATVTCSLSNIGDKKLYNAMVQVEVQDQNSIRYTKWTPGIDLSTGSSTNKVVQIDLGSTQYKLDSARIIAAGWDSENK